MLRLSLILTALLIWSMPGSAHEVRPAYLQIDATDDGYYDVLWKRPTRGDLTLGLSVLWPDQCREAAPKSLRTVPGALIERRLVDCGTPGLVGQRIAIDGLADTRTDALVRIAFLDGHVQTAIVKPTAPWLEVQGRPAVLAVIIDYFLLGVEHILAGVDHLLFVLGLTLIVRGGVRLVKTVTAFTVAHSITLALASLGLVNLPPPPVEAVIALSILFLASELVRQNRGGLGLTARAPWVIAFSFGLLHGFGFAGALAEVGLPQTDIPLALLTFNIGVEAGQLLFVTLVLAPLWLGRRATISPPRWLRDVPGYVVGSLAAFWLVERVAAFA